MNPHETDFVSLLVFYGTEQSEARASSVLFLLRHLRDAYSDSGVDPGVPAEAAEASLARTPEHQS
jgi:hypothetical protein